MTTGLEALVSLSGGATARYRWFSEGPRSTRGTVIMLAGLGALARESTALATVAEALAVAGHQAAAVDWTGAVVERTIAGDVEAVIAVHEALIADAAIDPGRVVLFGHSLGALVAALSASAIGVAGVVTYGAALRRFADALEVGAAQQLPLRGFAADVAQREARAAGALYRAVLREGRSRRELAQRSPALLACVAAADLTDDTLFGSAIGYLRSVDAIDPKAAWQTVPCPVHVLQGSFDWVVGPRDAEEIAGLARAGTAASVPSADHYLGEHPDLASSMRQRGAGRASARAGAAVVASCDVLLNHAALAGA